MGLFDYIGKKVNEFENDVNDARDKARGMNDDQLCSALARSGSFGQRGAYMQELQSRAREMSDSQLERMFDKNKRNKNGYACRVLLSVMEEREMVYKDENGQYHKC